MKSVLSCEILDDSFTDKDFLVQDGDSDSTSDSTTSSPPDPFEFNEDEEEEFFNPFARPEERAEENEDFTEDTFVNPFCVKETFPVHSSPKMTPPDKICSHCKKTFKKNYNLKLHLVSVH